MTATKDRSAAAALAPLFVAALVVCNLWHLLGGPKAAFWGIAASAAGFVWLARRAVPTSIARICTALAIAGLIAWPLGGAGLHSLERGVYIGAMIASVMVTVSLLARAAQHSAGLQRLSQYVGVQPYRRRYVLLAIGSQILPCLLGFAGVHMLFSVAGRGRHASETERLALFTAITRSFSAATLWSPTFGNMVILLALYPQLRWAHVLPIGVSLAVVTILLSMVVDHRLFTGRGRAQAQGLPEDGPEAPPAGVASAAARVLGAMLGFFGLVIVCAWLLELPISGAIAMVAPPAAFFLHYALAARGERSPARAWRRFADDARTLQAFAPEVLLFMAAGCGGSVIADSVPREWIVAAAAAVSGHAAVAILALILCIIAMSSVGLHPVLTVVVLASTFTPEAIGLPVLVQFCALLAGWGIASVVAPFSMLNLTAARYTGLGPYQISMRENWKFGVVAVAVATLGLAALS